MYQTNSRVEVSNANGKSTYVHKFKTPQAERHISTSRSAYSQQLFQAFRIWIRVAHKSKFMLPNCFKFWLLLDLILEWERFLKKKTKEKEKKRYYFLIYQCMYINSSYIVPTLQTYSIVYQYLILLSLYKAPQKPYSGQHEYV